MKDKLDYLLKMHGRTALAYSTMQKGMDYFLVDDEGYIAFAKSRSKKPIAFGLSNPISSQENYGLMASRFLEEFENASFIQTTEDFGEILDKMGLYVNEMGFETEIKINEFSYSGIAKGGMRRDIRKAQESGIVVEEIKDPAKISKDLEEITSEWIRTKIVDDKEIWYVARKMNYCIEEDVRNFASKSDGKYTGFVVFDPIYDSGKITGYVADILRTRKNTHPGTLPMIIKHAMDKFREERKEIISLGVSPFCNLEDGRFRHSKLMKHTFTFLYQYGNNVYPFKNLSFTKSRYGGGIENGGFKDKNVTLKKVYFAHQSRFPVKEITEIFDLTGITDGVLSTAMRLILPRKK